MTLLRVFRGLFAHDCPSRREMIATQDVCSALDARVDQLYAELRQLRGKVNGMRRWEKADEADTPVAQTPHVAPGPAIHRAAGYQRLTKGNY